MALEKGFECVYNYMVKINKKVSPNDGLKVQEIVKALLEKCIGSVKAQIKEKSVHIMEILFESLDDKAELYEGINQGIKGKQFKVVPIYF